MVIAQLGETVRHIYVYVAPSKMVDRAPRILRIVEEFG